MSSEDRGPPLARPLDLPAPGLLGSDMIVTNSVVEVVKLGKMCKFMKSAIENYSCMKWTGKVEDTQQ